MTIPSAAAVASSKSDAFAMSIAVKDMTMVWKLTSDSRRPKDRIVSNVKIRPPLTDLVKSQVGRECIGYTMQGFQKPKRTRKCTIPDGCNKL